MWIDDRVIKKCDKSLVVDSWIPDSEIVVLGRSNKSEIEVNVDKCKQDNVSILKRYGGGGTVLLSPGCVVVTVGAWVSHLYKNDMYFDLLNSSIIDVLRLRFPDQEFSQRGYSDIVVGDKKFVGTSLFRSRNYLLYQASILVDADVERISSLLLHPSKEPDYRKNRNHKDFLISLKSLDSSYTPRVCLDYLSENLENVVRFNLGVEVIPPTTDHIKHLMKRIK